MRPRGAAARSQARIFRRDGGKEEAGGEKRPMGKRRAKIVTVSGHLSLRGRRIRARPRSNKRRRSPKPMRCLSADNGDQFCAEKNWREREMSAEGFGRGRSCLQQQQEEKEGKRLEKAGAGWDSCIDRAIFVRPSLTEPPEILLLFSSFSAPPPPPPPPSLPQAPAGGKMEASVSSYRPQPPRPPPPNEKPLFCRHRGCEGRASSRPMGANFFSASSTPPNPPTTSSPRLNHRKK